MRKIFLGLLLSLISFLIVPVSLVRADEPMICQEHVAYVKLTPISFSYKKLVGTLCYKGSLENKVLQLTVHGVSYTRNYFDFSFNNHQYSYLKYAVDQGYAVFNIDRIGNGESDRPDGLFVNLENSAYTVHQVISKLRSGSLTGHAFSKIAYVGHSYGSFVGVKLAALYPNDVNGLVLTGYLHNVNPEALLVAPTAIIPAQLDPKFGLFFPLNYLTTAPSQRAALFFNTAQTDPLVLAQDEAEKDVFSVTALPDILLEAVSYQSNQISKPVQIVIGEEDFIFCGGLVNCSDLSSITNHENHYFSPAAQLEITKISDAGHDLNLHFNYLDTYQSIDAWIDSHVLP